MRLLSSIDADAELIVHGEAPPDADPQAAELAAFARELRSACSAPPEPSIAERQIDAIVAEAARLSAGSAVAAGRERRRLATWLPPARRGRAFAFRLAAAGLATLLAATGLAIAGISPPGPLGNALERIGISPGEEESETSGAARDRGSAMESPDRVARAREGSTQRGGDRGGAASQRGGATSQGSSGAGSGAQGAERRSDTGTTQSGPSRSTADEARENRAPPRSPGRKGDHAPESTSPPASPGSPRIEGGRGGSRPENRGSGGSEQNGVGQNPLEDVLGNLGSAQ